MFAAMSLFGALLTTPAEPPAPVGVKVADFTRPEPLTGKPWALAENTREAKATVIVFFDTGCPVAGAYLPKLAEYAKRYQGEGVVFVGINSHPIDTAEDVAAHAKRVALPFPVLKDDGTKLADKFAVDRTPVALVLDATRTVRYAGRIDDQFAPGVQRNKATTREMANALDAVLAGNEVRVAHVPAAGCKLTREKEVKATAVTYHKDVARIIQAKCQECHRPGEIAPFSLLTYKQAKGWADMMREVVADDVMPPWHADARHGHFVNDRRLTPTDKATLLAWVDAGCPEGDPKDGPTPAKYVSGWRLPKEPDLVAKMNKTFDVPAASFLGLGVPYQYIPAGEPFKEDTWVTGVEVRPDYRAVVHHIIVFVFPGDVINPGAGNPNRPRGNGGLNLNLSTFGEYMLAAYVPGDAPIVYPAGMAKKIPKGSQLVFEIHYTPNGKPGADTSMVGLVTSKTPPQTELLTKSIAQPRINIPAGADNHEERSEFTFKNPTMLYSFSPHMHVRGKAFRYELVTPDGKREVLCNVPKYDFNWQATYTLASPREIPAGSKLECTAWYDNSAKNPANPDPKTRVRWGNQTWDEMMIGFIEYHEKK